MNSILNTPFENTIIDLPFYPYFVYLIGAFVGLLVSLIIVKVTKYFLGRFQWENINEARHLRKPFSISIVALAIYFSALLTSEELNENWEHFFQVLFIVLISWLTYGAITTLSQFLCSKFDITAENNLTARKVQTQIRIFERILKVGLIIISFSLVLMTFDSVRQYGASILASAGIIGIIVGVAAQRVLANLLAGFQIAITQPIRIDDVVIVENEWGRIEEIHLTFIVVKIWDQRRLVVPSTAFIEKPFQNWTRQSSDLLGTVFIYADYTLPVDALREELTRILESTPLWDKKVNVLQVTNASDKTM